MTARGIEPAKFIEMVNRDVEELRYLKRIALAREQRKERARERSKK